MDELERQVGIIQSFRDEVVLATDVDDIRKAIIKLADIIIADVESAVKEQKLEMFKDNADGQK